MDALFPLIVLVVLFLAASLMWSGCVYKFFRDPRSGNGTYTDMRGRTRPKALGLSQVIAPFSRRKAEKILALSRTQRNRAALVRFLGGIAIMVLMVVGIAFLSTQGVAGI
ncbi:hypothetical protein CSQ85_09125 [Bifidobacterium rousetti]|uniref:hypothetical protein n=1 Tax=Bifidobacterium rousetti TaxID=2045439 RepID=UPI00123A11D3|nr:hypothetical protein [Bifidobacterium rousetti]KAA8818312.1 hypothetical protein CSQ85_09125 [Bifidobacterium rousetti]